MNSIPQVERQKGDQGIGTLVDLDEIKSNPGMIEESPGYIQTAIEIEKEYEGNARRYMQSPDKYQWKESKIEKKGAINDFFYGTENFLDRIEGRKERYRRRQVQRYR